MLKCKSVAKCKQEGKDSKGPKFLRTSYVRRVPQREGKEDCEVEEKEAEDGLEAPLHCTIDDRGSWV